MIRTNGQLRATLIHKNIFTMYITKIRVTITANIDTENVFRQISAIHSLRIIVRVLVREND